MDDCGPTFLPLKPVLQLTGQKRSSMYRRIRKGEFPKPVKISNRSAVWIEDEVRDWMRRKIAESRNQ